MDIADLRRGPHLSASSINDYLECGLYYRYSRIDKLKPAFKSDNLEFGSCIHKALADFHMERLMGNKMPLDDLRNQFAIYWKERGKGNKEIQYRQGKDFKTLLTEGKCLLAAFHERRIGTKDQLTVLAIEEPFRFTIEGLPVPIIGIMDLVEEDPSGSIVITDSKTASRAYSKEEADRNFQLSIYHMAAKANGYGNKNISLKIDCLVKTKKPKFLQLCTSRTEADELRVIKKIKKVWEALQKGIFIPNDESWKCKDCGYAILCHQWHKE
jgi:putative RecB family exonuclease